MNSEQFIFLSIRQNVATDCQRIADGGNGGDNHRALATSLVEISLARMGGYIVEDAAEGFALEIRTIGVVDEIEVHLSLFEDDLLDAELFAADTERHHTNQFFAYLWYLSETVCQALAIRSQCIFKVIAASQIVEFAIQQHALGIRGHILIGEVHLEIGLEGAVGDPNFRG